MSHNDDIEFTKADNVIQLTDDSFVTKNGSVYLKKGNQGMIIAYAPWCGACKGKLDHMKALSSLVNNSNVDTSIYVIDADHNQKFSESVGLAYFPSYYLVLPDGKIQNIVNIDLNEEIDQVLLLKK